MVRRSLVVVFVTAFVAFMAAPTAVAGAATDRLDGPIGSSVLVSSDPFTVGFMTCDFVQRTENPDGTSKETQQCRLDGVFVIVPDDGEPFECFEECYPDRAIVRTIGECEWGSDYFLTLSEGEEVVIADRGKLTVTPSGQVHVTTFYSADPPGLAECFGDSPPGP